MKVDQELEGLLQLSREISYESFRRHVIFYVPSLVDYQIPHFQSKPTDFPAISLTGTGCTVNCKHCHGKVLETMIPATSPEELLNVCKSLKTQGCQGCLITGGSASDGTVRLERFVEAISRIKRELAFTIVMHTGLVDDTMADMLKKAGVDTVLTDVFGSDKIPREVFGLDAKVEDYEKSLETLQNLGVNVVPHLTVGIYYGKLEGEYKALKLISKHNPKMLVVGALMTLPGTPMEDVKPPKPEEIARVLATARLMMPKVPIVLGCTRPSGKHRVQTEALAVKSGINAIAFPMEETVRFVESEGIPFSFSSACCSIAWADVK